MPFQFFLGLMPFITALFQAFQWFLHWGLKIEQDKFEAGYHTGIHQFSQSLIPPNYSTIGQDKSIITTKAYK